MSLERNVTLGAEGRVVIAVDDSVAEGEEHGADE